MNRRDFLLGLIGVGGTTILAACGFGEAASALGGGGRESAPLGIELGVWRARVGERAFAVLFEEATERPHSSPLNQEKREGTFLCVACNNPIFESFAKYESGTGWPSFWTAIEGSIQTRIDNKLILPRTEYHCANCTGHQGHVFRDGPNPTGLRYCNNGVALRFIVKDDPIPARIEGPEGLST